LYALYFFFDIDIFYLLSFHAKKFIFPRFHLVRCRFSCFDTRIALFSALGSLLSIYYWRVDSGRHDFAIGDWAAYAIMHALIKKIT